MNYHVCIYSPDGRLLKQHAPVYAGTLALGVRCVAWSPSSQFLAVGSYDGKVQFLNHYTWSSLLEFNQVDLNIDVDTVSLCGNMRNVMMFWRMTILIPTTTLEYSPCLKNSRSRASHSMIWVMESPRIFVRK